MIKIIKLHNNSEIIGHVLQENNNYVVVENPFIINYVFSPKNDRPVIGLMRYMPFADQRQISFDKHDIIVMLDSRKSMANYYTAVLQSYITDVDESIDAELESIAELENNQEETGTDMLAAMLERLNPNNSMH